MNQDQITSLVRHALNVGLYAHAADAFLMWERPAALAKRREDERAQFLTPVTETA